VDPKQWLPVGLLLFARLAFAVEAPMPEPVQRVLQAHGVDLQQVGIYVRELDSPAPLVSINAAAAFNPASAIKLLTTWLALSELGPHWTWPTEVYLDGDIERGVLRGDLILKGYGDPYFTTERLWSLQRQLRLRGLRSIGGDLIIDNGYFSDEYGEPGNFDGESLRAYNVLPDAMLVNFQAIRLYFQPDPPRNRVNVMVDPMPANLAVENRLQLKQGKCGGFRNGVKLSLEGGSNRDRLIVSGKYGQDCELWSLMRSALTGPTYAYGVFRSLWEESGGVLSGDLRIEPGVIQTEKDADDAQNSNAQDAFLRVESPPLSDVIRYINKFSNNVMSRHVFLTLGAEVLGEPATRDKGRKAAAMLLRHQGLEFPELRLDNGSGLSRDTRIAAASLGRILLLAGDSPWLAEYMSSMSLAGMDGTLRKRFTTEPVTGRMHLKTGRLDDVYATAGYVHAESGRDYVVVILQNYKDADRGPGEEAQAALLRWVYEQ
jgi:D-alanyl-D-alanine carboxypeptidase/D-alanyl-D-alanine-endopeptidase (penicillin-binding protein 4)